MTHKNKINYNLVHIFGNFDNYRGGAQRIGLDLLSCYPETALLVMYGKASLIEQVPNSVDTHCFGLKHGNFLIAIKILRNFLLKHKPQIIHIHSPKLHLMCRIALLGLVKPKIIVTIHNTNYSRLSKFQETILLKKADCVVASSTEVYNFSKSLMGHQIDQVKIIPNGIDVTSFTEAYNISVPVDLERFFPDMCAKYLDKLLVIGFVGRLVEQKNLDILISQFDILQRQTSNVVLLIIGDGVLRPRLEKLAKDKGLLGEKVYFAGAQKNILGYLKKINIFCMPSKWEGLSIAMLEAMAAGKPIITSNLSIFREILGRSDLSFPESKVYTGLQNLCNSESLRESVGHAMTERVMTHYSKDNMNYEYNLAYESLIER